MRLFIWMGILATAIAATSYSVGLNEGYEVGYQGAMADSYLGLKTPEEFVKGWANGSGNRNDRATD